MSQASGYKKKSTTSAYRSSPTDSVASEMSQRSFKIKTESQGERDMTEDEVSQLVHNALRRARKATSPDKQKPQIDSEYRNSFDSSQLSTPSPIKGIYPRNSRIGLVIGTSSELDSPSLNFMDQLLSPTYDSDHGRYRDDGTDGSSSTQNQYSANSSDDIIRKVEEEIANARKAAEAAHRRLAEALSPKNSASWSIDEAHLSPSMELANILDDDNFTQEDDLREILSVSSVDDDFVDSNFAAAQDMIEREFSTDARVTSWTIRNGGGYGYLSSNEDNKEMQRFQDLKEQSSFREKESDLTHFVIETAAGDEHTAGDLFYDASADAKGLEGSAASNSPRVEIQPTAGVDMANPATSDNTKPIQGTQAAATDKYSQDESEFTEETIEGENERNVSSDNIGRNRIMSDATTQADSAVGEDVDGQSEYTEETVSQNNSEYTEVTVEELSHIQESRSPVSDTASSVKEEEATTMEKDASPVKNEPSPVKKERSPMKEEASPGKNEISPVKKMTSPVNAEASPTDKEVVPANGEAVEESPHVLDEENGSSSRNVRTQQNVSPTHWERLARNKSDSWAGAEDWNLDSSQIPTQVKEVEESPVVETVKPVVASAAPTNEDNPWFMPISTSDEINSHKPESINDGTKDTIHSQAIRKITINTNVNAMDERSKVGRLSENTSRQIEFRFPYPVPAPLPRPRPSREILRTSSLGAPAQNTRWTQPRPELKELLLAARGPSLARRSNACGALKVLTLKNKNQMTLVRTAGFLDCLVFAASQDIPEKDTETAIDARSRAVATILKVSEQKDNRVIVFMQPGLARTLVKVIEEDQGEARVHACCALAMLAKTPAVREAMVKVDKLVDILAEILKGPVDGDRPVMTDEEKKEQDESDDDDDSSQDGFGSSSFSSADGSTSRSNMHSIGASSSMSSSRPPPKEDKKRATEDSIRKKKNEQYEVFFKQARNNACAALSHLSKHCAVSDQLCENSALMGSLITVSREFESPLHTKCVEIICNFTRFPGNSAEMARNDDLIDTLVKCGKSKKLEDRMWSLRAFQNMAADSTSKVILANSRILTLLSISAMRKDYEEQVAAVAALYNLSTEPGAVVPITNTKNVVATLVHLAHNTLSCSEIRQMACDALATIGLWLQTLAGAGHVPDGIPTVLLPSHTTTGWQRWD